MRLNTGLHAEAAPLAGDIGGRLSRELGQPLVGETLLLEVEQALGVLGQALGPHLRLDRHELLDLAQEPRLVLAGVRHLVDREAEAERLGDRQDAVGRRPRQGADDGRLVGRALDLDLVQAGQARLHRAQRLLQRLLEGPADRHRLADALHRGGEQRLGARELLEGEARHLGDDIVDRGLERGRRRAGDVVQQLVERVADGQARRDLGDREAGGLGGQRRGARHARVHLDHDHAAGLGIDRELHVRSAGIDADLAQARDRGVAHDLVFLVGERQRRRHRDRIAGVDAHRIDVLDRADDDAVVAPVAHDLHLVLFPAEHRFLDQHLADRRGVDAALHDVEIFVAIVGDAAAGAAQGEGRADDGRQADMVERARSLPRDCARPRSWGIPGRSWSWPRGTAGDPRPCRSPRRWRRSARPCTS